MVCEPRLDRLTKPVKEQIVKKTRRVDDEKKKLIGQWIQQESWEAVYDGKSATGMADEFTKIVFQQLAKICPEEELKITKMDGKHTSLALQSLAWQRLREYTKHGNSKKFKELKRKQKERRRMEGRKQLDKAIVEAGTKGTGWMRKVKAMSARPGEDLSPTFSLPSHMELNLNPS